MRRNVYIIVLILSFSLFAQENEHARKKQRVTPGYLRGQEKLAAELYKKVLPAVITIFTKQSVFENGERKEGDGLGSGVLISAKGHILTANHVVSGASSIAVKTQDGRMHAAEIIFSEPGADIALIQIESNGSGWPVAKMGNSDKLAIGQYAFAIGAPYGLQNSFSVGRISGFREFDRLYDGTISAEFIQTDAAINSGNSGGPLFNSQGEVIGIASRILSVSGGFQGIGFVVAINTAKQLLALEDRVWMGIEGIFLTHDGILQLLNRDLPGGFLVERVAQGSPADKAGIRGGSIPAQLPGREFLFGGDLILEFETQEACHSECLVEAHKHLTGLNKIPVTFLRGGQIMHASIDVSASRRNFLKR